ncbi:LLM class flavin-dependent oxidoreductase [Brevibacillus sp. M2.1A]|uniref:LLM class flavin-dependent oxidoreductase n=1 Tax=unclassified Brevibacillus TaxID=2684853 RepID=UPI00156B00C3|nr:MULTISPECIES: LLM class flavin-dependent oxidoreductase [unclassified Brevibacillus]MCC8437396.1 LLM class flavin-dependent oxidoreductase [Brevibacillus sp. M2.1A]MCE0450892.1 LLM class flavin-dependent oxidoreductase [Brevibacillus sp. AF8]MCM3145279.1 LLM class flavin-dependent oxidoreductase [Brevibacillus sp. MER 51]
MSDTISSKQLRDIPLSVLDLAPITEGSNAAESYKNSLNLAQQVEKWGFTRYWLAEHHAMPSVASSATSVLIGYIAGGTSKIRVGSGGIMLPNHAPLVIAEQFGTLESLYPGRIDLGLGRAPGADQRTARALRRDLRVGGEDFPELLEELREYLRPRTDESASAIRAIPGEGLNIPIWLLGSSDFSARLAGMLGLPFAFAGHFSPNFTLPALQTYRHCFRPSEVLDQPYAMVGVNVMAADTDELANRLATSHYQAFLNLVRGDLKPIQPPVDNMDELWSEFEKLSVQAQLRSSIIGSPVTVKSKLQELLDATGADELMITTQMYHHADRVRSFEIVADVWKS